MGYEAFPRGLKCLGGLEHYFSKNTVLCDVTQTPQKQHSFKYAHWYVAAHLELFKPNVGVCLSRKYPSFWLNYSTRQFTDSLTFRDYVLSLVRFGELGWVKLPPHLGDQYFREPEKWLKF